MISLFGHAARRLWRSPAFTCVSLTMLALAIGISTSTFSITNAVLLGSMPFPDSGRLVRVFGTSAQSQMIDHSPGNFLDIRAASLASFTGVAGYVPTT